jgi:hypothetical protein
VTQPANNPNLNSTKHFYTESICKRKEKHPNKALSKKLIFMDLKKFLWDAAGR